MTTLTLDLARLRAVAEAATPGEWYAKDNEEHWQLFAERFGGEGHPLQLIKAPKHSTPYAEYWPNEADATHISAFDPPTCLALLDALAEAQAQTQDMERWARREIDDMRVLRNKANESAEYWMKQCDDMRVALRETEAKRHD